MSSPPPRRPAVLVFARDPDAGPVKTRLAATIGIEAAREVYRRLAEQVWSGLEHPELERHLWIAPAESASRAAAWLEGATRVHAQVEGELGARLGAAFAASFAAQAPWAAAVGTDAPEVDAAMVLRAGAALAQHELAIVPALDGGYALIALSYPTPELFTGMPWSTPQLLEATLERASELGLKVALLPTVRDVDTAEDLASFPALDPRSGPSATRS
ncbi:MAG: TIGR04282 family arsenosugar biosynthesis glycosyltransferase [Planctomycetota bacterium]|nr:TIGR04282 family arsenosugar biosynthesis glycosyltransferase [Planctomycetota bacterium]